MSNSTYPEHHIKLFVGHVPPSFALQMGFYWAQHDGDGVFPLLKYQDLQQIGSNILSEYYWLFSLKRTMISLGYIPKKITILQYRRFVVNTENVGHKFHNFNDAKWLSSDEIAKVDLNLLINPIKSDFLVNKPTILSPHNILTQYSICHILRDLLRFSSDSIDFGIDQAYILNMLKSEHIITAPSVGTFDTKFLLDILHILERVALFHFANGFIKRTGYQERNIGYALERLHSSILANHLKNMKINYEFGTQVIQSETSEYITNPNPAIG